MIQAAWIQIPNKGQQHALNRTFLILVWNHPRSANHRGRSRIALLLPQLFQLRLQGEGRPFPAQIRLSYLPVVS